MRDDAKRVILGLLRTKTAELHEMGAFDLAGEIQDFVQKVEGAPSRYILSLRDEGPEYAIYLINEDNPENEVALTPAIKDPNFAQAYLEYLHQMLDWLELDVMVVSDLGEGA